MPTTDLTAISKAAQPCVGCGGRPLRALRRGCRTQLHLSHNRLAQQRPSFESADPISPSASAAQLRQTIRLTAPNHAVPASHLSPTPPLPDPKNDDRIPPSGHPPQGTPQEPPAHYALTQHRRRARAAKRPPSAPTTTRPEQPPAVGAVKPTPGKPSPSFHPPPENTTAACPRPKADRPHLTTFLLPDQLPDPDPPGCGIFGEALEAAVPVPCSCLGSIMQAVLDDLQITRAGRGRHRACVVAAEYDGRDGRGRRGITRPGRVM